MSVFLPAAMYQLSVVGLLGESASRRCQSRRACARRQRRSPCTRHGGLGVANSRQGANARRAIAVVSWARELPPPLPGPLLPLGLNRAALTSRRGLRRWCGAAATMAAAVERHGPCWFSGRQRQRVHASGGGRPKETHSLFAAASAAGAGCARSFSPQALCHFLERWRARAAAVGSDAARSSAP